MKLKIACFNPTTQEYTHEEITLTSKVFKTPEAAVTALRGMYQAAAPDVEVLHAVLIEEMERGYYE
ncbi:hypothetical protein [Duganella sp. FT27W]|uniref:hypothetical protein n=1 Tax=Duganella sp. FT27W TaxID=2654636 RepID=UPI00128D2BB5|nr:hypothetical protein [Duganella sp. FT27W]MPQ56283.1 hypothetical protein [Duganella sp. FT27W]